MLQYVLLYYTLPSSVASRWNIITKY